MQLNVQNAPTSTSPILNRKGEVVGHKLAFAATQDGKIQSYPECKEALKIVHPTWAPKKIRDEAERLMTLDPEGVERAWLRVDAIKGLARAQGQLPDSGSIRANAKGEISFAVKCRLPGAGNGKTLKEVELAAKHAAELKVQEDAHKEELGAVQAQLEELKAALAALRNK